MRKILLLFIVVISVIAASAQDFSNKGKDFWVGYGYHQVMTAGNGQNMVMYFATDQITTVTVEIPGIGYTQTFTNIPANTIFTTPIMPKAVPDARLLTEGTANKGIHVTATNPIVAYAHIYNSSVSGACVLLPTNTLGKEYYSINYTNVSNSNNANSWFYVIAADTGTTTIEITPSANTIGGWIAGTTYTITLTQGQVYNVMGVLTGGGGGTFTGVDLTGSKIKSISSATGGCKRIAVYSGSGRISIRCPNTAGTSSDNYMVQAFPKTAWGKRFLTASTGGSQTFNIYRVCVSDPAAVVRINGAVTSLPLINNFYYEIPLTNAPQLIESNLAITVAQYTTSQNTCGNGTPGDPEVIYLSPTEQNIKNVLFNSNLLAANTPPAHEHYVNVIIPNGGTAISSFLIDGMAPVASFIPHPQDPSFSYIRISGLALGQHTLVSDSGFNAIAYGFGGAESYGYNAGTNVRDLTQQLELETTYGIETSPSVCTNSPFIFKVYFPDSTLSATPVAIRFDSLRWRMTNPAIIVPNNFPILNIIPTIDSTNIRNGRQVNWYSLPTTYFFNTAGVDTLILTAYTSTNEGCGSSLDYEFPIQISDPPVADFAWTVSGCYLTPFQFTETTPQLPKPTYRFWWNFGDPASGAANTSTLRNPTHLFSGPGTYTVRYASITTPGCLSDTISHTVTVADIPNATITGNTTPVCINAPVGPDVTFTGTLGTPEYIFTYRINGGAPITSLPSAGGVLTIQAPTTVAGTFIYELLSVRNVGTAVCTRNITGQTVTVTITADGTIIRTSAAGTDNQTVCINTPITNITYAVGGSGNGGSVTGLPAGVTGTYVGGIITITGTPTVSGVFPYTVNTTGPCVNPTATGTITVTADATIALTSAAGSDNQTLCINTPLLVSITYAVGGTGTGGSVTGLPAGVTGVYAGGVITISGTPSVAGVFNYTVLTTGPCVIPTATGTITVTADGTITLTSAAGTNTQTRCINVAITNITYTIGGSATGGSVTGLPAGVNWVLAGNVFTISGAPTVIGTFPYTVTTTGPCVIPTATGTITVNPDASINLTSAPPTTAQYLCRNSAITNITYSVSGGGTGATVTGLPAGVTGVYAAGIVTISGAPSVAGLFIYTVNTTGTCVQTSATGYINVYQLPTAAFNSTAPRCETRVIDFTDVSVANTGAITGWQWNFGDPGSGAANTSVLQNPSHVFSTAGSYIVTLIVTTDSGCVSNPIASIPIVINNRPAAGFIIPEVCLSDTYAQFLDTSSIAAGVITGWNWNFGDPGSGPLNTSTLQNPQHSYSAVGPYNVELIVTSAAGCRDTIVQLLFVNGSFPVANFNVINPATLCANDSVAISEASTVFPGVITKVEIYWDNVGFPAVFDTDNSPYTGKIYKHLYPNFQAPLTRVFTIRYRAYSGGVCVNDRVANITVNAAPLVQFNNIPDTCLLIAPFQITQASEIGGVPGTGVFSGPGISPTGIFSPAIAGVGTHTLMYTFTSAVGGCVDTMSTTIRIIDTATALFTNVTPVCENTPASFTDVSTAPAGVVLANTIWDFGDGTPLENHAPGSNFTHVFINPGTYTVTMYNVSAAGCNSTVFSKTVTVDSVHRLTLTPASGTIDQTLCINTPIVPIVFTLAGGANGATVTGLPAGLTAVVTGGNTLTISGSPTTTVGSPFVYSIITTGNTCLTADTTGTITVEPDHTISFISGGSTNNQSVCVNTTIQPITYTLGGGATGVTITGLPPGIGFAVAGNTLTISGSPTAYGTVPFKYAITTTGNSCIVAQDSGVIKVNPYPVPDFTIDKANYCLPNALVKFTNTSTVADLTAMTYMWNFGEPASPSNTSTVVNPSHWYSGTGPYPVNLSVRSGAILTPSGIGCVHDTTVMINNIHPQPKTDFTFNKPSVCIGDVVTLTDNTDYKDGTSSIWNWNMGDGTTRNTSVVSHTYPDTISYSVTLFTVNSFGCNSDTISKSFTVYPYPHVNAGPDRSILEGGTIILETFVFANDAQILWTPNLYLNDNKIARPKVHQPLSDMTYRLTVTGRGGCVLSDEVFIKLLKFPIIPNTFTPNNDGINDQWRIDFLNTYPNNRVQVFTRTGKLVFESRGYDTPWDGTIKGKALPIDTYYYIIEPGNGRDPITGYVTILK